MKKKVEYRNNKVKDTSEKNKKETKNKE